MTQKIIQHQTPEIIKVKSDTLSELEGYITQEIEDAFSARYAQESLWRECLRDYEAIPKQIARNTPIPNAPNNVVPVGMVSTDIFYSTALQTIFTIDPVITARHTPGRGELSDTAKAMQDWNNWGSRQEYGTRLAANHAFLDTIQLGTGAYHIPWLEFQRKTKLHRVISAHPQICPYPIEDIIVPGGSFQDVQEMPFIGLRSWMTSAQLRVREKLYGWNIAEITPTGTVGWVRSRREQLARTGQNTNFGKLHEILDIYLYYDIDNDDFQEDLLVTWDRTSRKILKLRYNPYDLRPLEFSKYQERAFLFYGMGLMEKMKTMQSEITEIHNHRLLNMQLANTRIWKTRNGGAINPSQTLWPGKHIAVNDPSDFTSESMADVYPSSMQAEQFSLGIAEQIAGTGQLQSSRPSSLLSSRTPATTASIGAQQQNTRFAGAFDSMQSGLTNAVKQCNYRYQERVRADDQDVIHHILRVMGEEQGRLVVAAYRDEDFDRGVSIELTATSQRSQREVERSNLIQLGQILIQYYERIQQLTVIASNPQVPSPMRSVAQKIATAAGEWVERITRTFDNIRDPKAFVIEMNNEIDQLGNLAGADTIMGLQQLMDGLNQPREEEVLQ